MLNENLKKYRKSKSLSQEKIAEMLGVSRQAVTKWENGQSMPSSDNLIKLAEIYHVSLDELLGKTSTLDDNNPYNPKYNPILRTNLTRIAIICQAIFMNAAIQNSEFRDSFLWILITIVPLLLASVWMAYNHSYELNYEQRAKNIRIELVYCIIQTVIALVGYQVRKTRLIVGIALLVVCLIYVLYINPKYMNRQLVRK